MTYLESIADGLAQKVLLDPEALDDSTVVNLMADAMGASSTTLQESFLTAMRIRRAEIRANLALEKHLSKTKK